MDDLKGMTTHQLRELLHTLRHDAAHGKADAAAADRRHAIVHELQSRHEAPDPAPTPASSTPPAPAPAVDPAAPAPTQTPIK